MRFITCRSPVKPCLVIYFKWLLKVIQQQRARRIGNSIIATSSGGAKVVYNGQPIRSLGRFGTCCEPIPTSNLEIKHRKNFQTSTDSFALCLLIHSPKVYDWYKMLGNIFPPHRQRIFL